MNYLYWIGLIIMGLSILLFIIAVLIDYITSKNEEDPKPRTHKKFAIVIPARNESSVIEDLLVSIQKQTSLDDTYIIVENKSDRTNKIAERFGVKTYIRDSIKSEKTKAYALNDFFKKMIKEKKNYDLYFVFDANIVISNNYIKEMLNVYDQGYDIGCSYKNIKNSENLISICSGLLSILFSTIVNEYKNFFKKTVIITGAGFFISKDVIKKLKGYPFNTSTDEYELSLYCAQNNIKTYYNKNAEIFDEQPTTMVDSIKQRAKWIKGFFTARNNNIKNIKNDGIKKIGIIPYAGFLLSLFYIFILHIYKIIYLVLDEDLNFRIYVFYLILIPLLLYLILFIITYFLIIKDIEKTNINSKNNILALFYNPVFLFTFTFSGIYSMIPEKKKTRKKKTEE